MGGQGSGGHNRLSDEEKKKRGTYRADQSETIYDVRATKKVVAGPWLSKIPEPDYPLNEVGRAKYDEWTKELFEQNKLTKVTVMKASALALLHQKLHRLASEGKEPSANDFAKFQSALKDLDIAANAAVTATPGQKNRFAGSGYSTSRVSQIRIRSSAVPGAGKR